MGTHPIFESDFDCLTERSNTQDQIEISNWGRRRVVGRDTSILNFSQRDIAWIH